MAPERRCRKLLKAMALRLYGKNRRHLPDVVSTLYSEQYSQSTYPHLVSEEALLFWMALLFETEQCFFIHQHNCSSESGNTLIHVMSPQTADQLLARADAAKALAEEAARKGNGTLQEANTILSNLKGKERGSTWSESFNSSVTSHLAVGYSG